jgi:hypothetical protein
MTDASGTIPSDMVSVYDNSIGQWWIYYVSTEGQIKIIKGPKDGQVEDSEQNPPYDSSNPNITATNIPPAKTGNPQLGVCEYIDNSGKPQVILLCLCILKVTYADSISKDSSVLSR